MLTNTPADTTLWVVGRAHEFDGVDLFAGEPSELVPDIDGGEADRLLQDAARYGLVSFQRAEYLSPQRHYSQLRVTVEGLRAIGEWPPANQEHLPGRWEEGHYGLVARPWLVWVAEECTPTTYVGAPHWGMDDEVFERWRALGLLGEAGLIVASVSDDGHSMDQVRLSPEGRHALDPAEHSLLDTARLKLAGGNKIEATVIAVEKILGPWLRDQATASGLDTLKPNGQPRSLGAINDALKASGAIAEPRRANIAAALAYRNDCAHGGDDLVEDDDVEIVIDQVGRCCVA